MITRATLALGLVWLLVPHDPDLGLPGAVANTCDTGIRCSVGAAAQREQIFQRLRDVRVEIRNDAHEHQQLAHFKSTQDDTVSGGVEREGAGLQNASLTPFLLHRLQQMVLNADSRP